MVSLVSQLTKGGASVDIGRRVKTARKSAQLSQDGLARLAGMSVSAVAQIEQGGRTDPHYSTLEKLAGALDISVGELVGDPVPLGEAPTSSHKETDEERRDTAVIGERANDFIRDTDEDLDKVDIDLLADLRQFLPEGLLKEIVERALARKGVIGGWEEEPHSAKLRQHREAQEASTASRESNPLSPEWAYQVDRDLFRATIKDTASEELREFGKELLTDFYRTRTHEELLEEGPEPDVRRIHAFSLASIVNEELVQRGEKSLRDFLAFRRFDDAMSSGEEVEVVREEGDQEHQAG
jgi:transcriptional regulator with XRE-family HTH domain